MTAFVRAALAAAGLSVVLVSCAGGERPTLGEAESAPATPTPAAAVAAEPVSPGEVVVGEAVYELDFRCFDVDGASAFAVGRGTDPATGEQVTALVQQFPSIDYLALVFGDVATGRAWEPDVDRPFTIERDGDVFRVDGVEFVDYSAGEGEPVGAGSVEVRCGSFESEVPENVFAAEPG